MYDGSKQKFKGIPANRMIQFDEDNPKFSQSKRMKRLLKLAEVLLFHKGPQIKGRKFTGAGPWLM